MKLDPEGSLRRMLITLLSAGGIVGLNLTDTQIHGLAIVIAAWLAQSGLKAAVTKGRAARAAIATVDDAVAASNARRARGRAPIDVMLVVVALVGLSARPVFAQAADAPTVKLAAGQAAPYAGVLQPELAFTETERELAGLTEENAELKRSHLGWPLVVGLVVAAAGLGALATFGAMKATERRGP